MKTLLQGICLQQSGSRYDSHIDYHFSIQVGSLVSKERILECYYHFLTYRYTQAWYPDALPIILET